MSLLWEFPKSATNLVQPAPAHWLVIVLPAQLLMPSSPVVLVHALILLKTSSVVLHQQQLDSEPQHVLQPTPLKHFAMVCNWHSIPLTKFANCATIPVKIVLLKQPTNVKQRVLLLESYQYWLDVGVDKPSLLQPVLTISIPHI